MKRPVFYVDGRPFDSLRAAAEEVTRICGEDVELWRLRKIIEGNKGAVNGIPFIQKFAERPEEEEEAREGKRPPLMRIPVRGLPPQWR
jgi:hypothetical protein